MPGFCRRPRCARAERHSMVPMHRAVTRTTLAALVALSALVPSARAEDAPSPPAQDVARGLLAVDPGERARAEAALLRALRETEGAPEFARRLGAELRTWADDEERWIA